MITECRSQARDIRAGAGRISAKKRDAILGWPERLGAEPA